MSWLGKLLGYQEEIDFLRSELKDRDYRINELTRLISFAKPDVESKKADHPIPVNPRQSWGARKKQLEAQERQREVKSQVDQTAKYWEDKNLAMVPNARIGGVILK